MLHKNKTNEKKRTKLKEKDWLVMKITFLFDIQHSQNINFTKKNYSLDF